MVTHKSIRTPNVSCRWLHRFAWDTVIHDGEVFRIGKVLGVHRAPDPRLRRIWCFQPQAQRRAMCARWCGEVVTGEVLSDSRAALTARVDGGEGVGGRDVSRRLRSGQIHRTKI